MGYKCQPKDELKVAGMSDANEPRVRQILATVKPLAGEFYRLTGKPLGVTGEIAEYTAAEILGLTLVPARTVGYDALRGAERIQIKGRAHGTDARPGQRMSRIKTGRSGEEVDDDGVRS